MSGVIKGIKKVFKKVVNVVKKVFKAIKKIIVPLLIIAAIYFTAGLAIGAFGGTAGASFVSTMPGWGAGSVFSSMAGSLGTWTGFTSGGALAANAATVAAPLAAPAASGSAAQTFALGTNPAAEALKTTVIQANPAYTAASAASKAAPSFVDKAIGMAVKGAKAVGGVVKDVGGVVLDKVGTGAGKFLESPAALMMAGQGISSVMEAKEEKEKLREQRAYDATRGIWGVSDSGDNAAYPTQPNVNVRTIPPPGSAAPQQTSPQGLVPQTDPRTGAVTMVRPSELVRADQQGYINRARGV